MDTRLANLIGRCYDAALSPDAWHGITTELASALHAPSAALVVHARGGDVSLNDGTENLAGPTRTDPAWTQYWLQRDPWAARAQTIRLKGVAFGHELVPMDQLERSSWYHEFARPLRFHHVAGAMFDCGSGAMGTIAVHRDRGERAFAEPDRQTMAMLIPHVQRAFELQSLIQPQHQAIRATLAALEFVQVGVLVVDRTRVLRYANAVAEAWMRSHHELRTEGNRVVAAQADADARLKDAIRQATTLACSAPAPIPLSDSRSAAPIAVLWAMAMPPSLSASEGDVLLVLRPEHINRHPASQRQLLQIAYGLTNREVDIVMGLTRGDTPAEVAAAMGISVGHLRQRLKTVYAKTGVSGQVQLIARLAPMIAIG